MARRFIDISAPLRNDAVSDPPGHNPKIEYIDHQQSLPQILPFFPGLRREDLPDGQGWAIERVQLTTHNGTHLDAPWHFHPTMNRGERSWTIDEVPLEWCLQPGVKLDFRHLPDGYVATAAHPGRPEVLTAWMDGAVVDENDPIATDPDLDLFDERNGPPYSPEFLARYRSAQVARNNAITDWVEKELKRVRAAGFSDRPFTVMRTWADPRMVDPTIEPTHRQPNMCYAGIPAKANRSAHGIAAACTLRSWLAMWSLRTAQTRAEPHLARITCPALVINAEADTGVFPSDAQRIYDALAGTDKSQCSINTDHYFTTPGARSEQADTIAKWVAKRWR